MANAEPIISTRTSTEVTAPPFYKVIYINDDTTSVEFVINSLIQWFSHTPESAEKITLDIHDTGAAVVAVLPYEIAEQKGVEVTINARSNGYPLQIKLEPDVS